MQLDFNDFYEIVSPRCTVLVSTIDAQGRPNAAPFSFVTPVSASPPLILIVSVATRHTLANIRETGEFVLNLVSEALLEPVMICSKPFARGVNEIKEAGLTEKPSRVVKVPSIAECFGWIECRLAFEHVVGDRALVVGNVVNAEAKDETLIDGRLDIARVKPLLHIRGRRYVVGERAVEARTTS
ncbi:MAG: flavin reductase family protein [Chloroflexi bacterium]|nr:flavin reductase family protein [Chloroflexota bacterium]